MVVFSRQRQAGVFLALACFQAIGLYVFLKGFLLTRDVLDVKGRLYEPWERFPLWANTSVPLMPVASSQPPPFKRVIVVVIDALRFDFLLSMPEQNLFYLNQFPILQSLRQTKPENSLLYQFRADPPTTTTQRIKGIMTGSLPTFIDAGSNFASAAAAEDNLPRHLGEHYENIYFMGDETWVQLFPDTFHDVNRTFGSDSFNMFDLHTVDNRILSHMWPLLPTDDWQVAIAHFLGVDHCGHVFGPSHPNMAKKLTQMNQVLERIISHVDRDTLLVVFGDHGMSSEGNHGGESVEELMSGLFLYSERPLSTSHQNDRHQRFIQRIHQARIQRFGYDLESITDRLGYDARARDTPIVPQVYLAPTLSYLLHLPIPFSSLGGLIPDVIFPTDTSNRVRTLAHMVEQFRMNALQIYDYLHRYAEHTKHPGFSPSKLEVTVKHLMDAETILLDLAQQPEYLDSFWNDNEHEKMKDWEKQLEDAVLAYDAYITSIIKYCEAIWAQFDIGCMSMGIVLLGLCTFVSLWLMPQPSRHVGQMLTTGTLAFFFGVSCAALRYTIMYDWVRAHGWLSKLDWTDWGWVSVALAIGAAALSAKQHTQWSRLLSPAGNGSVVLAAVLVQAITLASNSFVIWEDRIVRFVLASMCLWWMLRSLSTGKFFAPLLVLCWTRLTGLTGQCREEQYPHCNYWQLSDFSLDHLGVQGGICLLAVMFIYILPRLFKQHLSAGARFAYRIILAFVMARLVHSIFEGLHKEDSQLPNKVIWDVYLPRLGYAICLVTQVATAISMLRSIHPMRRATLQRTSWTSMVMWSTVLAMLQPPLGGLIVLCTPLVMLCLSQGGRSTLIIRLTLASHYGHHLFFVTGHQAIFTSLPWKAAFVGFGDMNYYGGALLVALSTLTGPILSWLGWLVLLAETPPQSTQGADDGQQHPLYYFLVFHSLPTFLSSIFLLILRRHLMTWKIFAPRFLLQALIAIGSHAAAIALQVLLQL